MAAQLPTPEEFRQKVAQTNTQLAKIGVKPIMPEDIVLNPLDGYSWYFPETGKIALATEPKDPLPAAVLAHEAYHKHIMESVLTPEELELLNATRLGLYEKLNSEVTGNHSRVADYVAGSRWPWTAKTRLNRFLPKGMTLGDIFIVPVEGTSAGSVASVYAGDKRFPRVVQWPTSFALKKGGWEKVPKPNYSDPFECFPQDLLSDDEATLVAKLCWAKENLKAYHPEIAARVAGHDSHVARVVGKLETRRNQLNHADEAPAHFIKGWLSGQDMENYAGLRKYVTEWTYRSSGSGRGNGREEKLAGIVVGNFEKLRRSGVLVEDAVRQAVDVQNFLNAIKTPP